MLSPDIFSLPSIALSFSMFVSSYAYKYQTNLIYKSLIQKIGRTLIYEKYHTLVDRI